METNKKIIDGASTDPFDYALYDETGRKLKDFDCVVMKRKLQAIVQEKTKDMTYPELRVYLDKSMENSVLWQRLVERDKAKEKEEVFC
jgi:hypothetical protein